MKTPTQTAIVQFIESLIITALIAALFAIGPVLNNSGPIDWKAVATTFSIAFIFSLAHGGAAYLKAWNPTLAQAADTDVSAIEKKVNPPTSTPLQG